MPTLLSFNTAFAEVEFKYYSEGDTAILPCMAGTFNVSWYGPTQPKLGITQEIETNIYGKRQNWNTSIYYNKVEFNPQLPHLNRLYIVRNRSKGEFDLRIKNVSLSDEGLYRCEFTVMTKVVAKFRYLLQIKAPPTKMEFVNSTDDKITGIEGQTLRIICRVQSGKPAENLTLKRNGFTKQTGKHGSIAFAFIAERKHHNNQFVCEAISPLINTLTKTIKIDIKYKPILRSKRKVHMVNEGKNISICSSVDSNPAPSNISWSKNQMILPSKNTIYSSCYEILNVTRYHKGTYTCTATNGIGKGSVSTNIVVNYPPVVKIEYTNVTVDKKVRKLQCTATCVPTKITYIQWEHRSEYNEHIRYLNSTGREDIILPSTDLQFKRYQDTGIYICRVSNGIPDREGNYKQEGNGTVDDNQDNVEGLADPVENIMYHSVQENQNSMLPSPVSTLLPDNTSSNGTISDNCLDQHHINMLISETGTIAYSNGTIGQSMESRLNYADVVFQPSASQEPVRIIGLENRTVYADVDTSQVAIGRPENRSDTSSSDDDFVYIDGIENYIEKRRQTIKMIYIYSTSLSTPL
ncbi:CADM4 [Mytilus edulis]|uniref:CADM4 n=1 Tax=Mytilus edulis TaxID=6550 RepID=A0A8S3TM60_MYTED|nr:CADM4 [Mytilus edulis]